MARVFPAMPMRQLLDLGFVAPLPAIARSRIKERYRCDLGPFGYDCTGLNELRDIMAELDVGRKYRHALFLTAVHTHWNEDIIVESYSPATGEYLNGSNPSSCYNKLRPYSFCFSSQGPLPVEWMDESVEIETAELEEVYSFIWLLNDKVCERLSGQLPIPIGLMIDHRFKRSLWDSRMYSFAEGDSHEHEGRAVVSPVFESVLSPSPAVPGTITVAWTAFQKSEVPTVPLSAADRALVEKLEAEIKARTPEEARLFLDELETTLLTAQSN